MHSQVKKHWENITDLMVLHIHTGFQTRFFSLTQKETHCFPLFLGTFSQKKQRMGSHRDSNTVCRQEELRSSDAESKLKLRMLCVMGGDDQPN